ncbi:MAG TPA: YraN family protein [Acidobacteriota bacterium]|nr:YraN family protein [Acidobacteriota bacterium]HNR39171.1 YraN family protein [Acidobacteriota bacterium]HNU01394.1 YraN family protein [Acidobacteriota bacterium]HPB29569.1 YraN family protein [Acidobacteriota bacterium]HQO26645.1 YraN family protein [Acidobacteriota bacterium]
MFGFTRRAARRLLHDPKALGRLGEWLAHRRLAADGFDVVARNWRAPFGEVDLVARRGEAIHFVEVKTRVRHARWRPEDAVTAEKIERYGRLAAYFLKEHGLRDIPVRYHVVAVVFDPDGSHELEFIENAFKP